MATRTINEVVTNVTKNNELIIYQTSFGRTLARSILNQSVNEKELVLSLSDCVEITLPEGTLGTIEETIEEPTTP